MSADQADHERRGMETEPKLERVTLMLCSMCLDGEGGECHTPGCALWMNRAPDVPIRDHAEEVAA